MGCFITILAFFPPGEVEPAGSSWDCPFVQIWSCKSTDLAHNISNTASNRSEIDVIVYICIVAVLCMLDCILHVFFNHNNTLFAGGLSILYVFYVPSFIHSGTKVKLDKN